jgi:hypothetical protein
MSTTATLRLQCRGSRLASCSAPLRLMSVRLMTAHRLVPVSKGPD